MAFKGDSKERFSEKKCICKRRSIIASLCKIPECAAITINNSASPEKFTDTTWNF